ncbi:hypothetical protein C8R43DRAFT_1172318 [Mycena crocata]|nr:hypothetical protein C8R43DRAFT_1172318 [Mycena crocata]
MQHIQAPEASSTAVEIRVQLPGRDSISPDADIAEGTSTSIFKPGVTFRSGQRQPALNRTTTSELERQSRASGGPDSAEGSSQDDNSIFDILHNLLSLGELLFWLLIAGLWAVCTNIFLFRRPSTYASELKSIIKQAKDCREEAQFFLCARDQPSTNETLPTPVAELGTAWETYLEEKAQDWTSHSRITVFFSTFTFCSLQIAKKNDFATPIFGYLTFAAMVFCLAFNYYLSRHLMKKGAKNVHYAHHILERAEIEAPSMWNIHVLLSISFVSTWW